MEGRLTFYCVRWNEARFVHVHLRVNRLENRCFLPSSEKIAFAKFALAVCVRVHTFLGIEVVQYLSIHAARIVFAASILEAIVIQKKKERKIVENYTRTNRKREINWKKLMIEEWERSKKKRKNKNSIRGIGKKNREIVIWIDKG